MQAVWVRRHRQDRQPYVLGADVIDFARGSQHHADNPKPLTWDYCQRLKKDGGAHWACQSEHDLALCTCAHGHTTRMTGTVHQVATDGTVTPSYVCPVQGCTFHDWVRLVGFDGKHVYDVVVI
jgi:hypothetical protein